MIINEEYFKADPTHIAGIEVKSDGVPAGNAPRLIADINGYIARLEPIFLRMLVGQEVADNIEQYPTLVAKLANADTGQSVIAKYVYFYYMRDHATFNTIAGERVKTVEQSRQATPRVRLVQLWNLMVAETHAFVAGVEGVDIAPDYGSEIFEPINVFNL